jgi:hypothetical protein
MSYFEIDHYKSEKKLYVFTLLIAFTNFFDVEESNPNDSCVTISYQVAMQYLDISLTKVIGVLPGRQVEHLERWPLNQQLKQITEEQIKHFYSREFHI